MSNINKVLKHLEPIPKNYHFAGMEYRDVHILINPSIKQLLIDLGYSIHRAISQQDIKELREPLMYFLPIMDRTALPRQYELVGVPATFIPRGNICLHNVEDIKQYLILCSTIPNDNSTLLPKPILEVVKSFKNLHRAVRSF